MSKSNINDFIKEAKLQLMGWKHHRAISRFQPQYSNMNSSNAKDLSFIGNHLYLIIDSSFCLTLKEDGTYQLERYEDTAID